MAGKKIVCLGGGSLYFPRALADFCLEPGLSGSEVVLYDIDPEKSERMAALGRRLAQTASANVHIRSTDVLADALDGADFAVSSIGGSGAEITSSVYASYFHNADVRIPARYGIHQVIGDTCGPAGMMMALRSIPAYMGILAEMEKRCPRAILLNHSNPMAVLMHAMHKYSSITSIGICHGVQIGICSAAGVLGLPAHELECTWIGTNHYYWFTRLTHKGMDLLPELLRRVREQPAPRGQQLSWLLSGIYGYRIVYPEDDHIIEFYPWLTQTSGQQALPYDLAQAAKNHGYDALAPMPSAEPPSQQLRQEFMAQYQQILDGVELPEQLDNSITGEGLATMISAMANGRRQLCIVNVANRGAIPNLPSTAEVEVEAVTDSLGVRALQMGEAPRVLRALLEKRFVWQELVAEAAVTGNRNLALQAVLLDEMSIWPDAAKAMLDELLEASKSLLPQFYR